MMVSMKNKWPSSSINTEEKVSKEVIVVIDESESGEVEKWRSGVVF